MLKLLFLLSLLLNFGLSDAQENLKQIVNAQTVPTEWAQLLILKKEWRFEGSIELKNDHVKTIERLENIGGSIIFSGDSFKTRPVVPAAIQDFRIEYLHDKKFFLATSRVKSGTTIIPTDLPCRVYALDSSYLVIESIQDYWSFVKETGYQPAQADTAATDKNAMHLDKPIGGKSFTIYLRKPGSKKILWFYKAVN